MKAVSTIRQTSLREARILGYPINDNLPLIGAARLARSLSEVRSRILCLNAVVTVAWANGLNEVNAWVSRERIQDALTPVERQYLEGQGDQEAMRFRVEALWALVWAVGSVPNMDFSKECGSELASLLPNPKKNEPSTAFAGSWALRETSEIIQCADLAYCLHWAIRDALVRRTRPPGKLHPVYVVERRRALEWLIRTDDWDHVALDT